MITTADSYSTIDLGKYYSILPMNGKLKNKYIDRKIKFVNFEIGNSYNSASNGRFLNVIELRKLITENIDSSFNPK